MKWQPIETAPRMEFDEDHWYRSHSERLLLWAGAWAYIGTYEYTPKGKGRWMVNGRVYFPTHWMPLPKGPEVKNGTP